MTMTNLERCVFCAYAPQLDERARPFPAAHAVEIVETPNGPRALCKRHARDAVRVGVGESFAVEGSIIPAGKM